jgi:hypothetical protein
VAETSSAPPNRGGSRAASIIIVLIVVIGVVAAAYYQEQIVYTFRLQTWNKSAPGDTVVRFLKAGLNGDKEAAGACIGTREYQPREEDGKFVGYSVSTPAGTLHLDFADLSPGADPQPSPAEFIFRGDGAATGKVKDSKGRDVTYRLEMRDGSWKITEILAGRQAS